MPQEINWWFQNNRARYDALEKQAHDQIEHGDRLIEEPAVVGFHLYQKPTFQNHSGYTLFRPRANHPVPLIFKWTGSAFVRRVVWLRAVDLARAKSEPPWIFTTEPTLVVDTLEIRDPEFKTMIEAVAQIKINLINQQAAFGLDGCSYGFHKRDRWAGFQLNWWEHGAEGWHELTSWAEAFIQFVDDKIDAL